jgi:hypothetical protein
LRLEESHQTRLRSGRRWCEALTPHCEKDVRRNTRGDIGKEFTLEEDLMKKLIGLTLAVLVAAFVTASPAAAGSAEPVYKFDTKVKPAKPYKIAVVLKNFTNPFWLTHQKAADQAGKDLVVAITVLAPTKPDNVEEQIRILEDLISKKVDAVVVAPANTQAIAAGVQKRTPPRSPWSMTIPAAPAGTSWPTSARTISWSAAPWRKRWPSAWEVKGSCWSWRACPASRPPTTA